MKSNKAAAFLSWLLFSMCTVVLLLHVLLPDRAYSQAENRPLQQPAALSWQTLQDGLWTQSMDAYYADQIPGRQTFFHLNYLLKKYTGITLLNGVFLGKDALLGQPETPRPNIWENNLDTIATFASATGLSCTTMVIPSASSIQSDLLPAHAPVYDENPILDAIAASDSVLDVRPTLEAQKEASLYYKTDHHWTSYGAGLASMAYLQTLHPEDGWTLQDYSFMPVSHNFQGTLASKTGSIGLEDTIEIAPAHNNPEYLVTWSDGSVSTSIYQPEALEQKDQYQLFLGSNQALIRIETDHRNNRHLLILKDSYANSMIQFLLPAYQSITVVDPRYFYEDLDSVLTLNAINEVLFLYDYDNFVTDSSLQDVLQTVDAAFSTSEEEPAP